MADRTKRNMIKKYDIFIEQVLTWPSLTVQWLPGVKDLENSEMQEHRLLLGTHTDGEPNYVLIAAVNLPNADADENQLIDTSTKSDKLQIVLRIKHEGDVNRARYMPQDESIIATKAQSGDVLIFNCMKHTNETDAVSCQPELRLRGHREEGYGLSWNSVQTGLVLSASHDHTICLWDINDKSKENHVIDAKTIFTEHTDAVGDVAWNPCQSMQFGSVGDDNYLLIWDIRQSKPAIAVKAHDAAVNCLDFNPSKENILLTGASDKIVTLWDLRKLATGVYNFEGGHSDEIYQAQWSPHCESIFASAGNGTVRLWDVTKIDENKELIFTHEHQDRVSDLAWNQNEIWIKCSVTENNVLQIWKLNESFYAEDDAE